MGQIENMMARLCVQTAVYWASPVNDGFNGKSYDDPVEIKCRWEDRIALIQLGADKLGTQVTSKARVHLLQDVEEEGYLYLGTLDDLDSDEAESPETIGTAYRILRFDKTPQIRSTTDYVRKVYL